MHENLHIFVPYASSQPWTVRREAAVLGQFENLTSALSSARIFAAELRRRLESGVDIVVQDIDGRWSPMPPIRECAAAHAGAAH
jgi:hypothetical protein